MTTRPTRPRVEAVHMELLRIEQGLGTSGDANLRARWQSGRLLLTLRSPETNYLPKGTLRTTAATLSVSTRELSDRLRVAEAFTTLSAFTAAARHAGTWSGLLRNLPATREARTGSTRPPRDWRRLLHESLAHALAAQLLDAESAALAQRLYDKLDDGEP
jgi:hypothetical protein